MKRILTNIFLILVVIVGSITMIFFNEPYKENILNIIAKKEHGFHIDYVTSVEKDPVDTLREAAEQDLIYRFRYADGLMATKLSGSLNAAYNISYIINTPTKLLHHSWNVFSYASSINKLAALQDEENTKSERFMVYALAFAIILTHIFNALLGLTFASIMLVVGTLIGTIAHPILTLTQIPGALKMFFFAFIAAIKNLFFWK